MIIDFIHNVGVLILLAVIYIEAIRYLKSSSLNKQIFVGFLFGCFAVISMSDPVELMPGIIFDGRSIVLSSAALFGGPIVAFISTSMAAVFRIYIGGIGTYTGVFSIITTSSVGLLMYYGTKKYPILYRYSYLLVFSFLVHFASLLSMMTLPEAIRSQIIEKIALPYLLFFSLGTFLFVLLLHNRKEDIIMKAEKQKRSEQIKHHQQALLKWAMVDFKDLDTALKEATKISAKTMQVERVSIWTFDEEEKLLNCRVMYHLSERSFTSGEVLSKHDYPKYFDALIHGKLMAIENARTSGITSEFTKSYLIPLDIYSMLDVPILKEGKVLGVVCYEAIKEQRKWTGAEEEFASAIANSIALSIEIASRKELEAKMSYLAYHDPLTLLPNRLSLLEEIGTLTRKNSEFTVFFFDLDNFKQVNDSYGHNMGDRLLIEVSKRLSDSCKKQSSLVRLGGDEFILLVKEKNTISEIKQIATDIKTMFEEPFVIDGHAFYETVSIGITMYPTGGDNAEELLRNADSAMYYAKEFGRNNFQVYTESMTNRAIKYIEMEREVRHALAHDEFELYYQPQIDLSTEELVGFEALIRWNHPQKGFVSPDDFIPIAEETDLIVGIGEWVLKEVCRQTKAWHDSGYLPGRIAINLAGKQLQAETLFDTIMSIMEETGCRPEWIELEITEGFIMMDPVQSITDMNKLREAGFEIAIDDFGTGYSSLSYLKQLPITKLKIDRSFVIDIPYNKDDIAIVQTILAMSKSLGFKTIAEGVETQDQKQFLIDEGCQEMQGYLFSKPVSATDAEGFM